MFYPIWFLEYVKYLILVLEYERLKELESNILHIIEIKLDKTVILYKQR